MLRITLGRGVLGLVVGFPLLPVIAAQEPPKAQVSNGVVEAAFYLPDPERGYYRGTRFEWSGVMPSLKYKGHEYFGQWFPHYDPNLHDAIMGPVEEFKSGEAFTPKETSPGYDEAQPGETFVRLGVGALRRPNTGPYEWAHTYEIVDPGKWTIGRGKQWISFRHELNHPASGYAYVYKKRVSFPPGKPQMIIEHTLRNTGRRRILVQQYNHNLFVIDGRPTGPDTIVRFPFELKPELDFQGIAAVRGREIVWARELNTGEDTYAILRGFGSRSEDYDIRIENRGAGAGVRIRGDHPLAQVQFWAIRTTVCPEPFIVIAVEPGKATKWTLRYEFYELEPSEKH